MKKKGLLLLIAALILIIPFSVNAGTKKVLDKEYTTMSFKESLEQEGIAVPEGLTENDDQITIYLFRGHGCGYCKAFLTFLSSIYKDYGKYFKVVAFEVWEDESNWYLMNQISVLKEEKPAEGVPYYFIGEKSFAGYAESFDEDIKNAITNEYNKKKSDRYDIFKVAEKEGLISIEDMQKQFGGEEKTTNSSKCEKCNEVLIILLNLAFVAAGTIAIILFNNYKFNQIKNAINGNVKVKKEVVEEKKLEKPVKATKTKKTTKK